MSSNQTANLTIKALLQRSDKAWRLQLKNTQIHWIPDACVRSWDPNTQRIEIETWILDKKQINYTV
jgi:hypothetical protein